MRRTLLLLLGGWLLAGRLAMGAEPRLDKQDIFSAGKGGYPSYRIPAFVVTPKGALLAVCEARKTRGDWAAIDILMRRSDDGGKTWSEPRKFVAPGEARKNPVAKKSDPNAITNNNPLLIADQETGAVHFLFCQEYMRCFYSRSDDDGKTFSDPVEITAAFEPFRDQYDWKVLATGPGHGVQCDNGRLVVPVWLSTGTGATAHRPSVITTLYSDDHGANWQCGEIVAQETDPLLNPSESEPVVLADGRVLLNMRSEAEPNRRGIAISPDGATEWSRPVFDEELVEPICMASICRLTTASDGSGKNRILFSNPNNLMRGKEEGKPGQSRDRINLTVRMTYDECNSWPVVKTLEAGRSAYSDLGVGKDGTIYCLYEWTDPDSKASGPSIALASFNLEWLTDGNDSLDADK